MKKIREASLAFKLVCKIGCRTYHAFKSQSVRKNKKKTFPLLGCYHTLFKKRIDFQLYGNIFIEINGSIWEVDHCLPKSCFNLIEENEMRKCFNWVNLRPMYSSETKSKKAKVIHHLYLLQELGAKNFSKLIEEGLMEDFHC